LIGRKFLEHYDLKLDFKKGRNSILWPKDMPIIPHFGQRLLLNLSDQNSPILRKHQKDSERRDAAMEEEDFYEHKPN